MQRSNMTLNLRAAARRRHLLILPNLHRPPSGHLDCCSIHHTIMTTPLQNVYYERVSYSCASPRASSCPGACDKTADAPENSNGAAMLHLQPAGADCARDHQDRGLPLHL